MGARPIRADVAAAAAALLLAGTPCCSAAAVRPHRPGDAVGGPVVTIAGTPRLVAKTERAGQYVFFPETLHRVGSQLLLSSHADGDGLHDAGWTGATYGSADNGTTWYEVAVAPTPDSPTGPYMVKPCVDRADGATAVCFRYPLRAPPGGFGDHTRAVLPGYEVGPAGPGGQLRFGAHVYATVAFPPSAAISPWGNTTFMFVTDGTVVPLRDGSLMMLLYGRYENDTAYSIASVRSADGGLSWRWLATVSHGAPKPCDQPSEHDCTRLASGAIYCVWRSGGGGQPLCSSTSTDEGKTWSAASPLRASSPSSRRSGSSSGAPPPLNSPYGVEPKLVGLPNGALVLSAGRPGVFLWVASDPPTSGWAPFNVAAHHNAACNDTALRYSSDLPGSTETTGYTGLSHVIGTNDVVLSYDRLANGWEPAPWPKAASALFTVRVSVGGGGGGADA